MVVTRAQTLYGFSEGRQNYFNRVTSSETISFPLNESHSHMLTIDDEQENAVTDIKTDYLHSVLGHLYPYPYHICPKI